MDELPPWRRPRADSPPDEPDEPAPARELPPWPDWTPPPPPERPRPFPLDGELRAAHANERYARELYEGYRDGPQYAESGWPSLQRLHDEWQAAVRHREALQRQLARMLDEARGQA